ncbi:hypothetical protein OX283_006515 [Flavobacterium sp. SUN052]|uniref:hypothetical protein n=1 Tax=Flavobacterium sp. SUN052 TaxID=3002441 RepID=UPI00237DFEA8|nr:hypothetical protein [Flavobacterium sp. SUN052]MEC4004302.1 hypothetical protein [Flavobacterium sp. SUN052]
MKKILFGLIATILISINSNAQKIGVNQEDKYIITDDLSFLKEKWNQILKDQKINDQINNFKIESGEYDDGDKKIKYYAIIGTTLNSNLQMAEVIELTQNGEFYYNKLLADSGHTVSCSGCMAGCSPKKMKFGWVCTAGCEACSKTETVSGR